MTSDFGWLKLAQRCSERKAKPHKLRRLLVYIPVVLSHTHTPVFPSPTRSTCPKPLVLKQQQGGKTSTFLQDHMEKASQSHAQTPTQTLLAFTPQTRAHKNTELFADFKYNYPLV